MHGEYLCSLLGVLLWVGGTCNGEHDCEQKPVLKSMPVPKAKQKPNGEKCRTEISPLFLLGWNPHQPRTGILCSPAVLVEFVWEEGGGLVHGIHFRQRQVFQG